MYEWPSVVGTFWKSVYLDVLCPQALRMQYLIQLCLQVTALTMTLVLDGSYQPLIKEGIIDEAIDSLRNNKTADRWGLTSEAIKSLSPDNRLPLQSIFETRAKGCKHN